MHISATERMVSRVMSGGSADDAGFCGADDDDGEDDNWDEDEEVEAWVRREECS